MAIITPVSPSPDTVSIMHLPQIAGLKAGEDLLACAPCHIESDGLIYMSNATADDADAAIHGWTTRQANAGEPVTLVGEGARFNYAAGLTPGAKLYLGATDGRLDAAATVGDTVGVAFAVTATDIVVHTFSDRVDAIE